MAPINPVLIKSKAAAHSLPPALVSAIINVESSGDPWAWNPEPRYAYVWDVRRNRPFRTLTRDEARSSIPPHDFPALAGDRDQEWWAQRASWGLMQIMGAVAREGGFNGNYLPQILDPEENLEFGCRHLASLKGRYFAGHGWDGVIASYNSGSPRLLPNGRFADQQYVDRVRVYFPTAAETEIAAT